MHLAVWVAEGLENVPPMHSVAATYVYVTDVLKLFSALSIQTKQVV